MQETESLLNDFYSDQQEDALSWPLSSLTLLRKMYSEEITITNIKLDMLCFLKILVKWGRL